MTSFIAKAALLLTVASCGSHNASFNMNAEEASLVAGKPSYIQPSYKKMFQEGKRNEVLNRLEIATRSFQHGDIDDARYNLDMALSNIEAVYADNRAAEQARSLWYEEGRKEFKGEPYERSMAYYYRGIIYLIDAEYDNARASFINALMQDAFAEESQNRSDFAVMMFLAGWASQKMGESALAKEAYDELKNIRPNFPIPKRSDNILIISETGSSPRKLSDGMGHYELVFRRGKHNPIKKARIINHKRKYNTLPISDIYWQASSRGGRPVDAIIEGKAHFQKNTRKVGQTLANLGTNIQTYSSLFSESAGVAGGALSLIGVSQMALSQSVKPKADTRFWSTLPDMLHITTGKIAKGKKIDCDKLKSEYRDENNKILDIKNKIFNCFYDRNGNHIIWNSAHSR